MTKPPHAAKIAGMAWDHNPKPPSGIPAQGAGWGGPAKGAGKDLSNPEQNGLKFCNDPVRRADKQAMADRMLEILVDIAENSKIDMARLSAADKVLDRVEGKAVQRQITATVDEPEQLYTNRDRAKAVAALVTAAKKELQ